MKTGCIHLAGYGLCALQAYIGMYGYKESVSSADAGYTYLGDVWAGTLFFYSFFLLASLLWLFFLSFFTSKKLAARGKALLFTGMYAVSCVMVDYEIFVTRVSSWSTFTTSEELTAVMQHAYLFLFITGAAFYLLARRMSVPGRN